MNHNPQLRHVLNMNTSQPSEPPAHTPRATEELLRCYEFIVNTAGEFMTLISSDYVYEAVNTAYCHSVGRTPDQIVGKSVVEVWGQDTFDAVIRGYLNRCFNGEEVHYQAWFGVGDDEKRCFEVSYYPYSEADSTVLYAVVVSRDITERRRAEEELKQVREELEERVRDRTTELAEANQLLKREIRERKQAQAQALEAKETAETANKAKSDFLANMSHELRTPLNHIIGFTELVVDKHFGELNAIQEKYLNHVLQGSRHLLELINDILDLSKVEAGKLYLEPAEVHLVSLLENSLVMVKEKATKHSIKLSTDITDVPESITADERKLKQIMYNLLSNAVKFTPDGGAVQVAARSVGPDGKSPPKDEVWIEVTVTDTGIGLKETDFGRIFNPFEQADGSVTRQYEGTGLGLSLTKRLVGLHGGSIRVASEGEGKGSSFTFCIPATARAEDASD